MPTTFTLNEDYRQLCCSECGIIYFFPERWCDKAADNHKGWKCPNGHGQVFRESEKDELRRERDRLKQRLAQKDDDIRHALDDAQHERRRAATFKGHLTKAKKRIGKGTCPCCNRHFENLERHMASKHPQYAEAAE